MRRMDPSAGAAHIVLYGAPGCHLCDQTRDVLEHLLAERRAAGRSGAFIEDVDITADQALHLTFMETIPVVEVGDSRLELATSPARVRAFLDRELDGIEAAAS